MDTNTIAGLNPATATKQEVFDFVAFKLIQQGKQAKRPNGICVYRTADGAKCAAGHLIPDAEYTYALEQNSLTSLFRKDLVPPTLRTLAGRVGEEFLNSLQRAHDGDALDTLPWPAQWRDRMCAIAMSNGLDASILSYREQAGAE